ncbi:LpxI family protein [Rhizobium rhizosphaerae]|uniref:LpxI family protein n=1 Tax=Xaviernesmea rhizosphaerae TaxID=1672749 RepID=UPI000AD61A8E|nr:UDP-2,3-diacylglucosamine diphosphatase LpxI [Xaviernesmea rhizosphaerae]
MTASAPLPGSPAPSKGRLAIIAGGGRLPVDVAQAARARGDEPLIIALTGESESDWAGFERVVLPIGDFRAITGLLQRERVDRVVLSGWVRRRPDFRQIRPTLRMIARVPAVVRTLISGGDDAVLKMAIALIETSGARVIGVQEIVPDLLAEIGPLGACRPDAEALRDIAAGRAAADLLGQLDIGQGAVAIGGRVVALEGAEGTDGMLERVAELRREGRISQRRRGVLVKMCKPQQELRADLPSIGLSTIEKAAAAGLAGIAVEAGRALLLDRAAAVAAADAADLFILGIDRSLAKE